MLQEKGRRLPVWSGVLSGHEAYAQTIAELLRKEHGQSHRAIKLLMRQTHASERAVKHWLSGQHGPDTVFFLRLMISSPVIRAFVLGLIERPAAKKLEYPVDRLSMAATRAAYVTGETVTGDLNRERKHDVPITDPDRDPINDPELDEFNERQHWFLARVSNGDRFGAREIASIWEVSLKTARRDIFGLKAAGLLQYVGSCRRGRYRRATNQSISSR